MKKKKYVIEAYGDDMARATVMLTEEEAKGVRKVLSALKPISGPYVPSIHFVCMDDVEAEQRKLEEARKKAREAQAEVVRLERKMYTRRPKATTVGDVFGDALVELLCVLDGVQ